MLKKTMIAGFAMLIAVFAFQPVQEAEAKVRVQIGVGAYNPYYDGYDPYYGRGGYPPAYEPDYYEPRPRYYRERYPRQRYQPRPRRRYGRVNCRQAKRIVRNRGFYRIRARDCRGRNFTFFAKKRGKRYTIEVTSRNGRIKRISRRRR